MTGHADRGTIPSTQAHIGCHSQSLQDCVGMHQGRLAPCGRRHGPGMRRPGVLQLVMLSGCGAYLNVMRDATTVVPSDDSDPFTLTFRPSARSASAPLTKFVELL